MNKTILSALALLLLSTQVLAGIKIEPGIGYNFAGKLTDTDNPARDESTSGLGYFAKLGYQQLGFSAGVDYARSTVTLKDNADATAIDEDWKGTEIGVFVGYDLPILLRVWGTYVFNAELDRDMPLKNTKTYTGKGFKLGAGYSILPLMSLNLEYKVFTYDEVDSAGVTSALVGVDEISHKSIFASISIPLNI